MNGYRKHILNSKKVFRRKFRVPSYRLLPYAKKMMARNWESLIFYGIAKSFIEPVGLGRNYSPFHGFWQSFISIEV